MPDEKLANNPTAESVEVPRAPQEVVSPVPEKQAEHVSQNGTQGQESDEVSDVSSQAAQTAPKSDDQVFDDRTQMRRDIERVLEEDLGDIYLSLKPEQRNQFRIEGEKTAAKIEFLLEKVTVKLFDIIKLVREWLTLLPGVNRFFLEQEAKIKAEKVLALKKDLES